MKKRKSRRKGRHPKGAIPHPHGGYLMVGKPDRTPAGKGHRGRSLRVVAQVRDPIDAEMLAKALVRIAQNEVQRELEALHRFELLTRRLGRRTVDHTIWMIAVERERSRRG